jgi:Putative adhesin
MGNWSVDGPTSLTFDDVTAVKVRLIAGSVAVIATDGTPSLDVERVTGDPLQVTYEDGVLTITHPNLTWEGLLKWLRPQRHSAALTIRVPRKCATELGVVSATAVLSGVSAKTSVKGVSGAITLDGVAGEVDATTVSGAIEAQGLNGKLNFSTVSGDLTVADGWLERLDGNSVSGDITLDVDLDPLGGLQVTTVSGEVTIRLPAEADATVQLHSMTGDVRSEFSALKRSSMPASHTVSGSVGDGSGRVSVTTMSGRVMLLQRAVRDTVPEKGEQMEGETS